MQSLTRVVTLKDLKPLIVDVRVDLGVGDAELRVHGLSETVSRETRDRVRAALRNSGYTWGERIVHVTCSTAHPRSDVDLAVAAAVLLASGTVPTRRLVATTLVGELGLDGTVRPVPGVLPRAVAAAKAGFTHIVVSAANVAEAAQAPGITAVPVGDLTELVAWLAVGPTAAAHSGSDEDTEPTDELWTTDTWTHLDPLAVRAAALAAAGGHHTLFLARPGTGASLLPQLITTLTPDLTEAEALEVTSLHSLAGAPLPSTGLITRPPRICVHHSCTTAAVVGSATRPGMLSLAHRGVLVIEDLPEFTHATVDALHPLLEGRDVTIATGGHTVTRPAGARVVFTARDCPGRCSRACDCTCSPGDRTLYLDRIPRWLLAGTDLFLHRLTLTDPDPSLRPLHAVRAGVVKARERAFHRWGALPEPGQPIGLGEAVDGVPAEVTQELDDATRKGAIATHTAVRCLHLAWTMADFDGRPLPSIGDIRLILAQRRRAFQLLHIPLEP
ncbi:ATP-binding protein [Amycolatopsis sp. cmx-8-4]|uniref:ATP-binding protein n=1 Tax=Amycolatopsis sp. cmx-8-4 TaxID=2790947 RepID=UPI00397D4A11